MHFKHIFQEYALEKFSLIEEMHLNNISYSVSLIT
jgi:hypothetical protein